MWSILSFLSWQYRWENVLVQITFYPRQTGTIAVLLQAGRNVLMLSKKWVIFWCRYDCWDTVEYIQKLKYGNSLYRHFVWLCLVYIADIVCPTQLIKGQWKCWMAFVFHCHVEIYNSEEKIGNVKLRLLWQIRQPTKKRFRSSTGFVWSLHQFEIIYSNNRALKY